MGEIDSQRARQVQGTASKETKERKQKTIGALDSQQARQVQGTASKETEQKNNRSVRQAASKAGARHGKQGNKANKTKQW